MPRSRKACASIEPGRRGHGRQKPRRAGVYPPCPCGSCRSPPRPSPGQDRAASPTSTAARARARRGSATTFGCSCPTTATALDAAEARPAARSGRPPGRRPDPRLWARSRPALTWCGCRLRPRCTTPRRSLPRSPRRRLARQPPPLRHARPRGHPGHVRSPPLGWPPDVVHAHDWQAALVPAYLAWWGGHRPRTVVHRAQPRVLRAASRRPSARGRPSVERYGCTGSSSTASLSFLKAGLYHAATLTTVSPTYADEIRTPEGGRGCTGCSPPATPCKACSTASTSARGTPAATPVRAAVRRRRASRPSATPLALQRELGLDEQTGATVVRLVGRLTCQKGIDLLLAAMHRCSPRAGSSRCSARASPSWTPRSPQLAAAPAPGRVPPGLRRAAVASHLRGQRPVLVPSRFEPCGLTQIYGHALRHPADRAAHRWPRRHGGRRRRAAPARAPASCSTRRRRRRSPMRSTRAIAAWRERERFVAIQRRGMAQPFGWLRGAEDYRRIYGEAIDARALE